MKRFTCLGSIIVASVASSVTAHAQPAAAASAADPLHAGAVVPPMVYTSPLASYRGARDVEVGSWREANETVARIGGWRAYAREAHQADAPAPAGPAAAAVPATPAAAPAPAAPAVPGHGRH